MSIYCLNLLDTKMYLTRYSNMLSVTMFLITINDIFQKIPHPIKHNIFGDDCYIYCNGNNIDIILEILKSLHALQGWSNEINFKFSLVKSQCIIFSYKNEINHNSRNS
jgi:hypothetical protein